MYSREKARVARSRWHEENGYCEENGAEEELVDVVLIRVGPLPKHVPALSAEKIEEAGERVTLQAEDERRGRVRQTNMEGEDGQGIGNDAQEEREAEKGRVGDDGEEERPVCLEQWRDKLVPVLNEQGGGRAEELAEGRIELQADWPVTQEVKTRDRSLHQRNLGGLSGTRLDCWRGSPQTA